MIKSTKRKIIALLAAAFAVSVVAQSITVDEQVAFGLSYDHTSLLQTKIYTNGVLYRTYQTNEVRLVATGLTNNVYAVALPGFSKSITFTATVVSDGVESDPSNALAISFKPRKPGNLRRF